MRCVALRHPSACNRRDDLGVFPMAGDETPESRLLRESGALAAIVSALAAAASGEATPSAAADAACAAAFAMRSEANALLLCKQARSAAQSSAAQHPCAILPFSLSSVPPARPLADATGTQPPRPSQGALPALTTLVAADRPLPVRAGALLALGAAATHPPCAETAVAVGGLIQAVVGVIGAMRACKKTAIELQTQASADCGKVSQPVKRASAPAVFTPLPFATHSSGEELGNVGLRSAAASCLADIASASANGRHAALQLGATAHLKSLRASAAGHRAAGSAAHAALAALGAEMSEAQLAAAAADSPFGRLE